MAEIKIQVLLDDAGLQKQIAGANKLLLRFSANAKKLNTKRVREEIQISEKLYRDHDSRRLARAKRLNQQLLSIHRQRINQETISERSIATTRDRLYRRSMITGMLGGNIGGGGRGAGGGGGVRGGYSPLAAASLLAQGGGRAGDRDRAGAGAGAGAVAAIGAASGAAVAAAYDPMLRYPLGSLVKGIGLSEYLNPTPTPTGAATGAATGLTVGNATGAPDNSKRNALLSSLGLGALGRFGLYGAAFLGIQQTLSGIKDVMDYEKALYDFGRTARLTNEEMVKFSAVIDNMALATGRGRTTLFKDMADSFNEISKAIGSTDTQKITDMWKILQATGTSESTLKALEGAFKSLNLNEKNLKNLANIMQLPGAEGITDVKELAKWLEDLKNKGGIQIFSDKEGKNLRDFADIWDRIMAAKALGGSAAEFLKEFTPEKVANINSAADALERLRKKSNEEYGSGFGKFREFTSSLFRDLTGIEPMVQALDKFLGDLTSEKTWTAIGSLLRLPFSGHGPEKPGQPKPNKTARELLEEDLMRIRERTLLSQGKLNPNEGMPGMEAFKPPWEGAPATQITILNYGGVRTEVIDTSGRGKKVEVIQK